MWSSKARLGRGGRISQVMLGNDRSSAMTDVRGTGRGIKTAEIPVDRIWPLLWFCFSYGCHDDRLRCSLAQGTAAGRANLAGLTAGLELIALQLRYSPGMRVSPP